MQLTIDTWAEDTWFRLVDRDASKGGRLSDRGILQRFQPTIFDDWQADQLAIRFTPADDYDWYHRDHGVRFYTGSVSRVDVLEGLQFKVAAPLRGDWRAVVNFNKEDSPELNRNLIRVAFAKEPRQGVSMFVGSYFAPKKPSIDLEAGVGWRRGRTELSVSVAVLDAFNDFIFKVLGSDTIVSKTFMDYEGQPIAARARFDVPLGANVRLEAHGMVMRPSTLRAHHPFDRNFGFRQREEARYAGALLEWSPASSFTVGTFATYVEATSDRMALPNGPFPSVSYALTERTIQGVGYVLARPGPRWATEVEFGRNWRPERRVFRSGGTDVDYLDHAWTGQAILKYGAARGFIADWAFELDTRDIVRGQGEVPNGEGVGINTHRLRFTLGSRSPSTMFTVGMRIDLWGRHSWWDGVQGRLTLNW